MNYTQSVASALCLLISCGAMNASFAATGKILPAGASTKIETIKMAKDGRVPALQIFQERYIPEDTQKKFNLKETPKVMRTLKANAEPTPVAPLPTVEEIKVIPTPAAVISTKQEPIVETWRARKGEPVEAVLKRWSERNGGESTWSVPQKASLKKDFSFVGSYDDAINTILKQSGVEAIKNQTPVVTQNEMLAPPPVETAVTKVSVEPVAPVLPTVSEPMPAPKVEAPPPVVAMAPAVVPEPVQVPVPQEVKATSDKLAKQWYGFKGVSVSEIIKTWAEDAHVRVIWNTQDDYPLKETVALTGEFHEAVYKVLSQYDDEVVRPVGELYNDPSNGQPVLLIKTDEIKQ